MRINKKNPFKVICNLEDNKGSFQKIKSESYMFLPLNIEDFYVAVYFDTLDSSKYYIDINDARKNL